MDPIWTLYEPYMNPIWTLYERYVDPILNFYERYMDPIWTLYEPYKLTWLPALDNLDRNECDKVWINH